MHALLAHHPNHSIQVVRDHVRTRGLTVVKDLQSKGGMDVSDDDGLRDDVHLLPAGGGKQNITSDDVVAAMLEVWYIGCICMYCTYSVASLGSYVCTSPLPMFDFRFSILSCGCFA